MDTHDLVRAIRGGLIQQDRLLKLDTPLGNDVLLPHQMVGQSRLGRNHSTSTVAYVVDDRRIAMLSDGLDVSSRRQRRRHVPRQQFVDAVDRMVSNALKHIGEIRLGIEAVQACRADQAIHRGGTFAT